MYDMLPFPNIHATNIEELSFQTNNYLIQFKETLEFVLANIGEDNLSNDLTEKLNSLGLEVEKNAEETDDQFQQVAGKTITIADVINSPAFANSLEEVKPKEYLVSVEQVETSEEPGGMNIFAIEDKNGNIKQYSVRNGKTPKVEFVVNFDTGNLEYTTS